MKLATDIVKKELAKYGKSTSIRGVPKCFTSSDRVLISLWIISLTICTIVLIFLLSTSFEKYFSWPTMTQFGETIGEDLAFPDVTFCNIDVFADENAKKYSIEKYFEFVRSNKGQIKKLVNHKENSSIKVKRDVYEKFYSIPGYISNLPKHDGKGNKSCPEFIVSCSVFTLNWLSSDLDCANNFLTIWEQNYYTCYTLRTSKLNKENNITIRGLSLVLNVGPPNFYQLPLRSTIVGSQTRGVQVSVHSPGSSPDLKRGFSVAPGTENVVTIVQTSRTRQNKPYNTLGCTSYKTVPLLPTEKYHRDLCIETCKQKLIEKNCGCLSHYLYIPSSFLDPVKICRNFSFDENNFSSKSSFNKSKMEDVIDSYLCSMKYVDTSTCDGDCLIRCEKTVYDTYIATSPWPQPALQLSIFGRYIFNCTRTDERVRQRYSKYLQLYYDFLSNSGQNFTEHSELKQIQESLLVVKLVMKDTFPLFLRDQPAITWDAMFGIIGGTLSLWLGITVSTGVELIELIYLIVKNYLTSKKEGVGQNDGKM
ncbi:hypothetical protein HELRODRAFT_167076 [Helobdella robusta]|uniref:Uncharacterized protein n=1 Tax=Helobdella robusta TaxID=6412 RepID=T1EYZ5_HELRO|nr:hypothetical protein HELRODRAFT_167076 [Helobdella robusta]ESO10574.1 hypothetical protein HELRODRAFT_167076 [Helobdella robusta]